MRVTVHIPDSLGPRLKQAAETEGLSLSALTAKALELGKLLIINALA